MTAQEQIKLLKPNAKDIVAAIVEHLPARWGFLMVAFPFDQELSGANILTNLSPEAVSSVITNLQTGMIEENKQNGDRGISGVSPV